MKSEKGGGWESNEDEGVDGSLKVSMINRASSEADGDGERRSSIRMG